MPRSVAALTEEIRRYCAARPEALDSIEGIALWLTMQRYDDALSEMHAAIEQLVSDGVLARYRGEHGKTVYGCRAPGENS